MMQPVSLANVVGPLARTVTMPETQGKIYEIGGPERLAFAEILDKVARHYGVWPNMVSVPSRFARPLVKFAQRFRSFPLTYDELLMLLEDNVCDPTPFTSAFGIALDPYEAQIPSLCPHIYELAA
jgi:NADH dehydrogenase